MVNVGNDGNIPEIHNGSEYEKPHLRGTSSVAEMRISSMDRGVYSHLYYRPMLLFRWLINALTVLLVAYVVPGIHVENFYTALIVALVLGILNAIVRPILIILTLPITLVTLGLFTLVINAALFWLVSTWVKGFNVDSFGAAVLGALVLWLLSLITNFGLKAGKKVVP